MLIFLPMEIQKSNRKIKTWPKIQKPLITPQSIVLKTILVLDASLKLAKNTTFHSYLYISSNKNN